MTHIARKKRAVYIAVGQVLIAFVHHITIRLIVHQSEHSVGIAAYHRPFAPRDRRTQQCCDLYISLIGEPTRELHRIFLHKIDIVYAPGFEIQQFFKIIIRHNIFILFKKNQKSVFTIKAKTLEWGALGASNP